MSDQDQNLSTLSPEEQEIKEVKDFFLQAPRLSKWLDLFLDKDNKATYMQATECAFIAYDLDRTKPQDRKYASELGSKNARKCKNYAQTYFEQQGMGRAKVLDLIAALASNPTKPNPLALKMLASIMEVYQERPNILVQNNTTNNTQNNTQVNISDSEANAWRGKWKEFLEKE